MVAARTTPTARAPTSVPRMRRKEPPVSGRRRGVHRLQRAPGVAVLQGGAEAGGAAEVAVRRRSSLEARRPAQRPAQRPALGWRLVQLRVRSISMREIAVSDPII